MGNPLLQSHPFFTDSWANSNRYGFVSSVLLAFGERDKFVGLAGHEPQLGKVLGKIGVRILPLAVLITKAFLYRDRIPYPDCPIVVCLFVSPHRCTYAGDAKLFKWSLLCHDLYSLCYCSVNILASVNVVSVSRLGSSSLSFLLLVGE